MTAVRRCPALIISAPGSVQGKTIFGAALARYHCKQGRRVKVFKMGPDFLDPMILSKACGQSVHQLDLWMMGEDYCRHLLYEAAQDTDLIIVEGVMGLFDGDPSTADLAQLMDVPVVALIDVLGMSQTFHAVGYGLSHFRAGMPFLGIIANGVTTAKHAEMLLNSFHPEVDYLGALPYMHDSVLPSRYHGQMQIEDIEDLDARIDTAAEAIASADLGIVPEPVQFRDGELSEPPPDLLKDMTIAVARDRAFAFIYQDNLNLLEKMGAHLTFFSPLQSDRLPDCDAVYLPGGYQELHLRALANNNNMKQSIRKHYEAGKAIYAEGGGMMYLLDGITDLQGNSEAMVGLLPGSITMQRKLMAFGYQSFIFRERIARSCLSLFETADANDTAYASKTKRR